MITLAAIVGNGKHLAVSWIDGDVVNVRQAGQAGHHDVIGVLEGAGHCRSGGRVDPQQQVVAVGLALGPIEQPERHAFPEGLAVGIVTDEIRVDDVG
ncbi:MAG: hypothetical protein ACRDV9_04255 [Acidimicrobiia bacterium]